MKYFWPSFFGFLIVIFLMIGLYRSDLMDSALQFTGWFLVLTAYSILAAAIIAGAAILYLAIRQRQLAANRPVDGAFPLQRYRLKDGRTLIVNPNTMISPAAYIDKRAGYVEWEHPAGWDVVVRIREMVERANLARAMFPGDAARTNRFGAASETPRVDTGALKLIDAKPAHVYGQEAPEVRVAGSAARPLDTHVDPCQVIARSAPLTPAVGETADHKLVRWRLAQHPHARIHGASQGSGKTNMAKTALTGLLCNGAHVVVLDRRRFKDFRDFDGKAELIDTSNPAAFVETMQRLEEIYRERDRILGKHGAANIDDLHQRLVRYVVLITEFGALCSVAQEEGLLKQAMAPLARIMREAGAAGIHLMFEDQVVEKGRWPRGVAANASAVFTGHLPLNLGAAGGYHHAHQLGKFVFHHNGELFRSWDMRPITRQLLATAPAYDARLAVLDGQARAVGDGERFDGLTSNRSSAPPPPPTTGTNSANAPDEREATNKWEDVTIDFFRAHPDLLTGPARGITDLARAMADADDEAKPYTAYKGIAHTYYHKFRNNVRLPGGHPLGVDVTNGYAE